MIKMIATELVFVAFCILIALSGTFAKTFNVGNDRNWGCIYLTTIQIGDNLLFKYNPRYHDVWRVTEREYNLCDEMNFIESWALGEDRIVLDSAGTWYFICSKPKHCTLGQKFYITVANSTSPPTIAPSRSAPSPTIAPPPTSAPSPTIAPSTSAPSPTIAPSTSAPSRTIAPSTNAPSPTSAPTPPTSATTSFLPSLVGLVTLNVISLSFGFSL